MTTILQEYEKLDKKVMKGLDELEEIEGDLEFFESKNMTEKVTEYKQKAKKQNAKIRRLQNKRAIYLEFL